MSTIVTGWKYEGDTGRSSYESTRDWLARSRPQRVDMMQQLCASEHFLIDGDSLLVEALLNQHCDWALTQPLHIVYLAEEILSRYRRFGGQFTVVFFQCNGWWWTGKPQFELARTLLLQRLIAVADAASSSNNVSGQALGRFSVAVFQDYLSRKFLPFCAHVRPEFALVTDGCQFDQLLDASVAKQAAASVRALAMLLLCSRMHVAFTSRQVVLNNTVYVFAIRVTTELQENPDVLRLVEDVTREARTQFGAQLDAARSVPVPAQDTAQTVLRHAQTKQLTARDAVTHLALLSLLREEGAKPACEAVSKDITIAAMAKLHLLANALQSVLPIEKRALNGGRSALVEAYLNRFAVYAAPVAFGLPAIVPATAIADEYADSVDGHLLARVVQIALEQGAAADDKAWGAAAAQACGETWAMLYDCINNGSSADKKAAPLVATPFFPLVPAAAATANIKVFEKEPAAPAAARSHTKLNRNIPLVRQLGNMYKDAFASNNAAASASAAAAKDGGAEASAATAAASTAAAAATTLQPWTDAKHSITGAGWKQFVPGFSTCEKLDEYREVEKLDQKLITAFVKDQRESGQSMNVKPVDLTAGAGKDGDDGEEGGNKADRLGEKAISIMQGNTLNKEERASTQLLTRRDNMRREARAGTLDQRTIVSYISDVSTDATVSDEELQAFRDYVASKNTTEHKFLFEDNITDYTLLLSKIKDMDANIKLTAFTMLRRHCALHAQQFWLLQLWSLWDAELQAANDAARAPRMGVLVDFFLELHAFITRLQQSRAALDKEIASTVCAMAAMLNFGENYQQLIIDEISKCYTKSVTGGAAAGAAADAGKKGSKKDKAAAAAAAAAAEDDKAAAAAAAAGAVVSKASTGFRPDPVVLANATELDLIIKQLSPWCPARFQLCVMGELLERPRGIPDKRMPFPLDPWQKKLLDAVDDGYSAVVTAPTSAGKTFIALYAMTKALRESDTDVVVYVCPTRSLVNQALGDTWARFGKKEYGRPGFAVVGVLGGGSGEDGYVMLPFNCQVLVTVPEVLEIILLSPVHQEWAKRIKFVVFDEIHSIESSASGAIWERLLMAVGCPFVALSATLGNTDELVAWMNRTRSKVAGAKPCILVPGKADPKIDRFNDIEKHIVLAEPRAISDISGGKHGGVQHYNESVKRIHPLSTIGFEMLRAKGVEDLRLVPRETVELFDALHAVLSTNPRFAVFARSQSGLRVLESLSTLEPGRFFASRRYITKPDARRYEDAVVRTLCNWAEVADRVSSSLLACDGVTHIPLQEGDHQHFFDMVQLVLAHFSSGISAREHELVNAAEEGERCSVNNLPYIHPESPEYVRTQLLPLLISLHAQGMTPCITFTFAEEDCEAAADAMVRQLQEAEQAFRDSPQFEEWVKGEKEKFEVAQRETASQSNAAMHTQRKRDEDGNVVIEQVENQVELKEYVVPEVLPMFSFKPRFSRVKPSDWEEYIKQVTKLGLKDNVIAALKRGIAVHHNGVSGRLRRIIERLFRLLAVPVIVCTETLALGIHSPCKSVVIAGDNVRLTTSQFRQMSGRAGRRGEDFLGHCIFLGVPLRRVQRLLTSDLDRLKGHVTVDATTILRLDTLTNFAPEAHRKEVEQVLRQLFTEPLLLEGRSRVAEKSFERFAALWSRAVLNWAAETGFVASNTSNMSVMSALVTRVCGTLREVHAGPGSFLFAYLLASGALHRATAHFSSGDSDECLNAMYQLFSLLFTTHCDFNTPLEIHESILEDRMLFDPPTAAAANSNNAGGGAAASAAATASWSGVPPRAKLEPGAPGSECKHSIILPSFKEILDGQLRGPIAEYNERVLSIATEALRGLSSEASKAKLPLSESNFSSGGNGSSSNADKIAASAAFNKIAALANTDVEVRHPLSALSGATDKFSGVEDMCRSLRDGLYVDSQMLPTLDLSDSGRHDGRDVLMNAAVADYLVNGYQNVNGAPSRKFLHEYNGLPPRDSWYTLSTHFKCVNSIVDFLGKDYQIAPGDMVEVENKEVFSTEDHVMLALLAYQDTLTTMAASIHFQSASVRQFNEALKAERRAKNRAKRIEKNKK